MFVQKCRSYPCRLISTRSEIKSQLDQQQRCAHANKGWHYACGRRWCRGRWRCRRCISLVTLKLESTVPDASAIETLDVLDDCDRGVLLLVLSRLHTWKCMKTEENLIYTSGMMGWWGDQLAGWSLMPSSREETYSFIYIHICTYTYIYIERAVHVPHVYTCVYVYICIYAYVYMCMWKTDLRCTTWLQP